MRRVASLVVAFVAVATSAAAGPPVHLHVAEDSTCEGSRGLASRLAPRGIVLAEAGTAGVDVDVRARPTGSGAEAELVIRSSAGTASRSLSAPTCDEVLDALVFTLGLALEQAVEEPPAPPTPGPATTPGPARGAEQPAPAPRPLASSRGIAWGGGAGAGIFAGASPSAAAAVVVHADVESRADGILAPAAILGATFVLPSSTSIAGADVASALQMGTVDGCPVRFGSSRLALRPCVELQVGRLEARSAGFTGARLESAAWVALAAVLRGRAELGAGISLELAIAGGSPLIQDAYFVGGERVLTVGPLLFSAIGGLGVHFP